MSYREKRVLWLLNHKTLMPFEVNLLRDFGFEVFTPKIIPSANLRNCVIDFSYDNSLTIPQDELKTLNQFNFYEGLWSSQIITIINRYFGTIFIIPFGTQVSEAVTKFEGQIVFRAFGLENTQNYRDMLNSLYGYHTLAQIYALKNRFWFAEGYEQLHECEPRMLSKRALFLPLGLPSSFWKPAHPWNGSIKKILFVCPNVITNPYYSAIYQQFKKDLGDLPHLIVGAQDAPVNDPNMLGFVTDEKLTQLYSDCAVLYYHSRELRHVHYSPLEAVIHGMPIVYFKDSLLARLNNNITTDLGCINTIEEARSIIQRLLVGDNTLIKQLCQTQKNIVYPFADAYCQNIWGKNIKQIQENFDKESVTYIRVRKLLRFILIPIRKIEIFIASPSSRNIISRIIRKIFIKSIPKSEWLIPNEIK